MPPTTNEELSSFVVQVTGQLESGDFGSLDNLYARYSFHIGNDWTIIAGLDTGLSQTARKTVNHYEDGVIWNFPIDVTFKSTNVHGWPRIAVSIYGIDFFGRDVIRGYGSILIPLSPGSHVVEIETFVPLASSPYNQFFSWLLGNPPEFFDSKFVCQSEGREVTRVQRTGSVKCKLNIITKGMQAVGYNNVKSTSD